MSAVPTIDFTAGCSVPVDNQSSWSPSANQRLLADEIIAAFSSTGFLCLINTGITQQQIDKIISEVKRFFNNSVEEKQKYVKGIMSNVGWTEVNRENLNPTVRVADYKETFNYQPTMSKQSLPVEMTPLHQWWQKCSSIALQVMTLMAVGLKLKDPHYITQCHKFGESSNESAIRVNFYPKTANVQLAENQLRCGEHSDYGSITLLCQDSAGLEVMNRITNSYQRIAPVDGGIVVNIGDMMQMWTSDILIANRHRVLVPEEEILQNEDRVSIPFFAMPDQDTLIKCLMNRNKHSPVIMKDWLKMKIDQAFSERNQTEGKL